MDVDKRVGQYIQLRDIIKQMKAKHEAELAPYIQAQEALNKLLLNALNNVKAENMRTKHGTLYKKNNKSASIVDKQAFWDFVVANKLWELVDKRANAQACADYADEHKEFPPGVNYTNFHTAGVRKS
jgi:hypothetical protein